MNFAGEKRTFFNMMFKTEKQQAIARNLITMIILLVVALLLQRYVYSFTPATRIGGAYTFASVLLYAIEIDVGLVVLDTLGRVFIKNQILKAKTV